jgi:hypothetical protein
MRIVDLYAEVARHWQVGGDLRHACTALIGELCGMLAQASVQSLEPDLIPHSPSRSLISVS